MEEIKVYEICIDVEGEAIGIDNLDDMTDKELRLLFGIVVSEIKYRKSVTK